MDAAARPGRDSAFYWAAEVRPGLRVAFTSTGAGNLGLRVGGGPERARRNRGALESAMGVDPGHLHFMNQTHSDRVVLLQGPRAGAPDADAMISAGGAEPLAVLVADCVPIVLADTAVTDRATGASTGATAVVHAGRAGVGNGIVRSAVDALRRHGARELSAWIGPSVCGSCYEVPEDMVREIADVIPEARSRTRAGTPALDLPAAVRRQLEDLSVSIEPVEGSGVRCTLENPRLFSHRREPGAGRIAGLVWRT